MKFPKRTKINTATASLRMCVSIVVDVNQLHFPFSVAQVVGWRVFPFLISKGCVIGPPTHSSFPNPIGGKCGSTQETHLGIIPFLS